MVFCEFMIIPIASQKRKRISARVSASLGIPMQNISTSSMKSRCVILKFGEFFMPLKYLEFFSKISALLRPSATRRKSRGERGQPCLSPLSEVKKGEATPFISIAKVTEEIQEIIHLMKGTSNPRCLSSSLMKDQFTRSKAFERSSFNTTPLERWDFRLCSPSCATPIASCICHPFRKPNCSFEITSERIGLRHLEIIFAIIL